MGGRSRVEYQGTHGGHVAGRGGDGLRVAGVGEDVLEATRTGVALQSGI